MSRGRKALPEQIKRQRGTSRSDRFNKNMPVVIPVSKMPPTPKHLNSHGKRFWRKLGKVVLDLGTLNEVNIGSFELLCSEYGIYREAQENMSSISAMIDRGIDKYGNKITKVTAFRKVSEKAFANYLKMATEFGLTPSSISRIVATKKS